MGLKRPALNPSSRPIPAPNLHLLGADGVAPLQGELLPQSGRRRLGRLVELWRGFFFFSVARASWPVIGPRFGVPRGAGVAAARSTSPSSRLGLARSSAGLPGGWATRSLRRPARGRETRLI